VSVEGRPPNFVVFLADDLGYGDVGSYGHPTIRTPNIDLLARDGLRFTQFYSGYMICTPSRSSLLTGRLPVRNGIFSKAKYPLDMIFRVFLPDSEGGLPQDEITIPKLLKQANYSSSLIGKWHLGHLHSLPTQCGFDEFYGLPYAQDEGCPPSCPADLLWHGVPLYDGEKIVEQPVNLSTLTPRYNVRALDFLERNKDNPFFLLMAYDEVHVPLFASPEFLNKSLRGFYGDAVMEMDNSIGVIMNRLKTLGLAKDTLVVFSSDNGAWMEKDLDGGSNGLLRGQKGETWEGGLRVPGIFYWPGMIAPGEVTSSLGSQLDLFATFANLSGLSLPENKTYDSFSLVPILLNPDKEIRDVVFYYRATTLMAVRYGHFKAHYVTRNGWNLDPPEKHNPPLLFHLDHDPSERFPLKAEDYKDVLARIAEIVAEHEKSVGTLPEAQLDLIDITNKIAPCCNHDDKCVCTEPGRPYSPAARFLY
jgi:arylsulfatase A-like enzyme